MEHFSWLFQLKLLIGCACFLLNSPFISDDCFTNRFRFSDHKSIMHEAGEVVIRFDREAKEGGGGVKMSKYAKLIQQDFNLSDVSLEIIASKGFFILE